MRYFRQVWMALLTPVLLAAPAARAGYTYSTFQVPGALDTVAQYVDGPDYIVGGLYDASGNVDGFVDVAGAFSVFDDPGALDTYVSAVSPDHTIVGESTPDGVAQNMFILKNGTFTDVPFPQVQDLEVESVNASGQIVGYAVTNGTSRAFLYAGGAVTWLSPLGYSEAQALSINAAGDIAGFYVENGLDHGFLYANGMYSEVEPPGSMGSLALVVAPDGEVGGLAETSKGQVGWVLANGHYMLVTYPGGSYDQIYEANISDTFIGTADLPGRYGAVGFTWKDGMFETVDPPGSIDTVPLWIDDRGDVVGYSSLDGITYTGFLAIPAPEPEAWLLMLVGVGALGASLRRRTGLSRRSAFKQA